MVIFHSYVNVYQRVILGHPFATAPAHCWGSAPSKSQVSPPAWLAAFGSYIVKLGRSHHWFYGYLYKHIIHLYLSIFIILTHLSHPFYLWFAAKRLLCNPRGFHRSSGPRKCEPWRHGMTAVNRQELGHSEVATPYCASIITSSRITLDQRKNSQLFENEKNCGRIPIALQIFRLGYTQTSHFLYLSLCIHICMTCVFIYIYMCVCECVCVSVCVWLRVSNKYIYIYM